jgi:hypothetical protein
MIRQVLTLEWKGVGEGVAESDQVQFATDVCRLIESGAALSGLVLHITSLTETDQPEE